MCVFVCVCVCVSTHCPPPLQHTAKRCSTGICGTGHFGSSERQSDTWHPAIHCNTLQHTATHCNTLQHTATHYNTLQHAGSHCNTGFVEEDKLWHDILAATNVNLTPGRAMHCSQPGWFRVCFASQPPHELKIALARLAAYFAKCLFA